MLSPHIIACILKKTFPRKPDGKYALVTCMARRHSATEKLEIIQLVGQSNLPQRRCLANLGIPRQTFYCPASAPMGPNWRFE